MDLVGLLVMVSLAISGVLTPSEALSGFSAPAVVTIWAVFIISGGLTRSGLAAWLGRRLLHFAGNDELRILFLLMVLAAVMSYTMNTVGVVAMLMPVVMDISRQRHQSPSRFLLPVVHASLLGGMATLFGTPSNLLANEALIKFGYPPFSFTIFTAAGLAIAFIGILFNTFIGRKLLPQISIRLMFQSEDQPKLIHVYDLDERMFLLILPPQSPLAGKTLAESRLGTALGFNVIAILRGKKKILAPSPETILQEGDRFVTIGRVETLEELSQWQQVLVNKPNLSTEALISEWINLIQVKLSPQSQYIGQTINSIHFRKRFGANVLAIMRDGIPRRTHLTELSLGYDDVLLLQITQEQAERIKNNPDFIYLGPRVPGTYRLAERFLVLSIPEGSALIGKTLEESRLGQAFNLNVVGIMRGGDTLLMPIAEEQIQANDYLIIQGKIEDLAVLQGLQSLTIDHQTAPTLQWLETDQYGMVEVMLHPRGNISGKTLKDIHFREKYGLNVLAIWSSGRAYRSNLFNRPLRFGDALLVYGKRDQLNVLSTSTDFMVLSQEMQIPPLFEKAPLAAAIVVGTIMIIMLGWLPSSIAMVSGAVIMLLSGCLSMNEAYRSIEWRVVFLIASIIPLGIAIEKSGTANLISNWLFNLFSSGTNFSTAQAAILLSSLFVITSMASQVMSNSISVIIMAPIAINLAQKLQLSPYSLIYTVAIASSTCFLMPFSHAVNMMVMGTGGYRTSDYVKSGLPLIIIILISTLIITPVFFPLFTR